jgi:predicted TIM-barrel fold metal-dependent hydrolase
MARMKVIDAHEHWWKDMKFFPPAFQWSVAQVGAYMGQFPPQDPWEVLKSGAIGSENFLPLDPDGSRIIEDQKFCGHDVSVILPLDWGFISYYDQTYPGWREDHGYSMDEINKFSCDLAKKYPGRVYSFAGVDPRRHNASGIFEKAVKEYGAIGLKIYCPNGYTPLEPKLYPLYQKCVELDVPLLTHSGYTFCPATQSMPSHPSYVEKVACDFPDMTIIIAHSGIQTFASNAWWEECMGIARSKFNIYLDLAAWNEKVSGLTLDIPRMLQMLRIQIDIVGAHRIIFGTDLPGFQLPDDRYESRKFIDILRNLPEVGHQHGIKFTEEEQHLIAYKNAERVLKLPEGLPK